MNREQTIPIESQEVLSPAQTAEWLAVYEATAFGDTKVDSEHIAYKIDPLGYLAANGNSLAIENLAEITDSNQVHSSVSGKAAAILAEVTKDSSYIDKILHAADDAASDGMYDGHKYRQRAAETSDHIRKQAAIVAKNIGYDKELRQQAKEWKNESVSYHMLKVMDEIDEQFDQAASDGNPDLRPSMIPNYEIDENDSKAVEDLVQAAQAGQNTDELFDAVEHFESPTTRLVAYNTLAQTLKQ